jgi:hypothetical protein
MTASTVRGTSTGEKSETEALELLWDICLPVLKASTSRPVGIRRELVCGCVTVSSCKFYAIGE